MMTPERSVAVPYILSNNFDGTLENSILEGKMATRPRRKRLEESEKNEFIKGQRVVSDNIKALPSNRRWSAVGLENAQFSVLRQRLAEKLNVSLEVLDLQAPSPVIVVGSLTLLDFKRKDASTWLQNSPAENVCVTQGYPIECLKQNKILSPERHLWPGNQATPEPPTSSISSPSPLPSAPFSPAGAVIPGAFLSRRSTIDSDSDNEADEDKEERITKDLPDMTYSAISMPHHADSNKNPELVKHLKLIQQYWNVLGKCCA